MLQFDIKFAILAECIKIIVCLQCESFHCSPLLRATSAKDRGGASVPLRKSATVLCSTC